MSKSDENSGGIYEEGYTAGYDGEKYRQSNQQLHDTAERRVFRNGFVKGASDWIKYVLPGLKKRS